MIVYCEDYNDYIMGEVPYIKVKGMTTDRVYHLLPNGQFIYGGAHKLSWETVQGFLIKEI